MSKIATKVTTDAGVRFDFADGTQVFCDVASLPQEMIIRLAIHGASQKVGDSYAGAETLADAIDSATATWHNVQAGIWATGRSSTGGVWVEALGRAADKPHEEALAVWNRLDDDARKALKRDPRVKAAKAAIDAERAQAKLDALGAPTDEGELDLASL